MNPATSKVMSTTTIHAFLNDPYVLARANTAAISAIAARDNTSPRIQLDTPRMAARSLNAPHSARIACSDISSF